MIEDQAQLTSAEITSVWTVYMNDSIQQYCLGYFPKRADLMDQNGCLEQPSGTMNKEKPTRDKES